MPRGKKAVQVSAGPYPTAPIIDWMMEAPLGEIEALQESLAHIYQHRKKLERSAAIHAGRARVAKNVAEVPAETVTTGATTEVSTPAPTAKKSHKKQAAGAIVSGFGGKQVVAEDPTQAAAQVS